MNVKIFQITLICLICTFPVFANNTTSGKATDNWLQTDNWLGTETWLQPATSNGRPTIGAAEQPKRDPTVAPVGDGMLLLLGLGTCYGWYVLKRKKKTIRKQRS